MCNYMCSNELFSGQFPKHNFLSHIDNQSQKVKDVANLMFAPVYGHKEPIDEETGKP